MKKQIAFLLILCSLISSYLIISCTNEVALPVTSNTCDMHLSASVTNVNSSQRGMITVHAQNGSGYLFQLNNGVAQGDSTFTDLNPASYIIYVTNSTGCRDSMQIVIDSTL